MRHITIFVAALLAMAPQVSSAQSLVDVSKAEEARRQSVKKPVKVYTNDNLKPDFTTPSQPATPAALPDDTAAPDVNASASTPGADAGAGAPTVGTPTDRAYWNGRITTARAAVARSRLFAEALQTRINALTADAINRDDPAQRSVLEQDRGKALAELDRLNKEIADQTKAVADVETEARRAGVPAGWLR